MGAAFAVCSSRGGRKVNEDCVRVVSGGGVFAAAAADGLGGHGGGAIASALAADTLTQGFLAEPSLAPERLTALFTAAHKAVTAAQTPSLNMKSTGVALFILGGAVCWGHAGDSRLYRFHNGVLIARTLDHSVSQLAVYAGEITPDQIRHHPDRNKVLRAFGGGGFKAELAPVVKPEPGLNAFLLCTDGFWEYVWETEMESELCKAASPDDWLAGMTRRLSERVPKDHDNFSACAVFLTDTL